MQLEFLECENNANVFGRRCLLECNQWRLRRKRERDVDLREGRKGCCRNNARNNKLQA